MPGLSLYKTCVVSGLTHQEPLLYVTDRAHDGACLGAQVGPLASPLCGAGGGGGGGGGIIVYDLSRRTADFTLLPMAHLFVLLIYNVSVNLRPKLVPKLTMGAPCTST